MIIKEHNVTTGQIIEREMTAAEIAQWEADEAETIVKKQAQASNAAQKAALLEQLGITEDQAKLLLS